MNEPKTIEWFYDFISPYAYLASQTLEQFPTHVRIVHRPILFAGLLKQWETRGPGEIAPMRKFTYRQIAWLAEKNAIPIKFPPVHPFNPLKLLRLNIALGDDVPSIADRLFRFVWAEGKSSDNPADWAALVDDFGLSSTEVERLVSAPAVKAQLIANTEQAIARDIFGVPGFILDDEVFWGFDSMPFINDYLRNPALFNRPAMQQADGVGEGIKRR